MSAGLIGHEEAMGQSPTEPRGFWCLARLTGEPCRADVGLCDLCYLDLYVQLEAFVPLIVPALDAAAQRDETAAAVRRGLDQVLLGAVGFLFDPVEPVSSEERACELLAEHDPPIRTTVQLAGEILGGLYGLAEYSGIAELATDLRAALALADAVLRGCA